MSLKAKLIYHIFPQVRKTNQTSIQPLFRVFHICGDASTVLHISINGLFEEDLLSKHMENVTVLLAISLFDARSTKTC